MAVRDALIEEVDVRAASDAQLDEINAFVNVLEAESYPEDPPRPDEYSRTWYRTLSPQGVIREFVVRDDGGSIIGRLETWWEHEENNQHLLDVDLSVHPEHRRRGIGTQLLSVAVQVAEEAGKRLLLGHTVDRVPAGESFAKTVGAESALIGHTNRLALAGVDRAMVERWVEEGPTRAPGYSLFAIDGPVPDELVDQFLAVIRVMNTAPRENLDMEDWNLTPEQLRHMEASNFAVGTDRRFLAARHESTGDLVGFTEMWRYPRQPQTVRQWGTGVFPEHRGHALGKWLKAKNILRVLDEWPEVVDIRTHNADSNDPMLGINRALGFKPYTVDINWQIATSKAKQHAGRT